MDRAEAIIEEVKRRMGHKIYVDHFDLIKDAIRIGLELYDSGWQPPVDPDVLLVREVIAAAEEAFGGHKAAASWRAGEFDKGEVMQAVLAAYRKHKDKQCTT